MFNGCSNLTTIYVGDDWNTSAVTDGYAMFYGCTNLPNYDSEATGVDKAYVGAGGYLSAMLTPADVIGQMQMYVNYYDRYVKQDFENPTIGILLCSEKSDALVELTLPEDSNVYASQYSLYLPDKALLQRKLKEWREELKE